MACWTEFAGIMYFLNRSGDRVGMCDARDDSKTVLEATEKLDDMIGLHGAPYYHLFDRCFGDGNVPRFPFLKFPDTSPLILMRPLLALIEAMTDTCGRMPRHLVFYGIKHRPISLEDIGTRVKADHETGMLRSVVYPHQVVIRLLRRTKYPERFARGAQTFAVDSHICRVTVKYVIEFAWYSEPDRRFLQYA